MLMDYETLHDLKKTSKIKVKCDRCGVEWLKSVNSIVAQRSKRNGEDICKRCATIEYNKTRPMDVRKRSGDGYKNKYFGKKLEEIVGDEKAKKMKLASSEKNSGKNNINFGGKYSRGFADRPLTGKIEDRYGSEKASKMRHEMSQRMTGKLNHMYGKPSPQGSGNGWSGWYQKRFFRSLLELSYLKYLIDNNILFENGELKEHRIELPNSKTYFPDFYLVDTQEYVEVKPLNLINSKSNMLKFNTARKLHGNKFKIITENDIQKIQLDDIIKIYDLGDLRFMKRYEEKFAAYKEKHNGM